MGIIKQIKIVYFILGMLYTPFLYAAWLCVFYVMKMISIIIIYTKPITLDEFITLFLGLLFMFVFGLILLLLPIWFYQYFLRSVKK